jgi:hypothetical protein
MYYTASSLRSESAVLSVRQGSVPQFALCPFRRVTVAVTACRAYVCGGEGGLSVHLCPVGFSHVASAALRRG